MIILDKKLDVLVLIIYIHNNNKNSADICIFQPFLAKNSYFQNHFTKKPKTSQAIWLVIMVGLNLGIMIW